MRFVITGANRGLGLELSRQLVERGDEVEAATRDPEHAHALNALVAGATGRLRVHRCDVASDESVRAFAAGLGGAAIDVLINNAGVMGELESLERMSLEECMRTFDIDALGPVRVTRALLPLLRKSSGTRRIVHISSGMGSIADNTSGGAYGYRMAKAALNMASKSMAVDLAHEGIISVVMNPGWVKTDMGGAGAPTPVEESVSKMIAVIDRLGPEDSGSFADFKGGTLPW